MRIAIIGRTEILFESAKLLSKSGNDIVCIVTAKEAPEYKIKTSDFEKIANEWHIPFVNTPRIIETIDLLKKIKPDIGVSVNYTGIIPQSVIDIFPYGIINAHGGDLPRYRGNACQAWAIINCENKIGLCIHKMNGGEVDSGDILAREYFGININTKIGDVLKWTFERVPVLFNKSVEELKKNPEFYLEKQSTESKDILRCYPRLPEDGRIDWSKSSKDILRLINATNKPYGGAYGYFQEKKIIIWDAQIINDGEVFFAIPGQVILIGGNFIIVACGEGKLKILIVEYENQVCESNKIVKSIRKRLT
ncbi:MAG: formyl transferase [Candidatus Marinimicrobia bacterium]|nr:formyl transferase [Candidatus Neomarinimicrobiota bacterium]|tara:strand:- start:11900 stop:12820 length:921 start_codon:yes stop_codon:yes gene_type:complete